MPPDVFPLILSHLRTHSLASVRLVRAVRSLWFMFRHDGSFWLRVEEHLPLRARYEQFVAVNKHMGVFKRALWWANYCDACCSGCGVDLRQTCPGTFAVRVKLCFSCRRSKLVSEVELLRHLTYVQVLRLRATRRHCWLSGPGGGKVRYFVRDQVNVPLSGNLYISSGGGHPH